MAQKVVVELIDDLDGTPIPAGKGETIDFAVDGVSYSIDLGPKNAKAFRKSLDTYIAHATRTGGRRHRRTARPRATCRAATRPKPAPSGNGHWPTDTRSPPAAASPPTSNRPTTTQPETPTTHTGHGRPLPARRSTSCRRRGRQKTPKPPPRRDTDPCGAFRFGTWRPPVTFARVGAIRPASTLAGRPFDPKRARPTPAPTVTTGVVVVNPRLSSRSRKRVRAEECHRSLVRAALSSRCSAARWRWSWVRSITPTAAGRVFGSVPMPVMR